MKQDPDMILGKFADPEKGIKWGMRAIPPPENCDLCSCSLAGLTYYVDGAVEASVAWANMCPSCFLQHGKGVGWGQGQMYMRELDGKRLLVAGFPPKRPSSAEREPEDSDSEVECEFCGDECSRDEMVEFKEGQFACRDCEARADDIMSGWVQQMKDDQKNLFT